MRGLYATLVTTALAAQGPCDLYQAAGNLCVAAHSTVRALFGDYDGLVYQLRHGNDTMDISVTSPGGFADVALHEKFCGTDEVSYTKLSSGQVCEESARIETACGSCGPNWGDVHKCQTLCNGREACNFITFFEDNGCRLYSGCRAPTTGTGVMTDIYQRNGTACTIIRIYDQTEMGNDLNLAPGGGYEHTADTGVTASKHQLKVGGNTVYGAYFEGGMGYRRDKTKGIATGDNPESMYMVTGGKHYNSGCCFDYGNAETDNNDDGAGTMEAIYWGNSTSWGHGAGSGPWVMADMENGLFAGNEKVNPDNTPIVADYVTAMLKGRAGGFALKGGDAQTGKLKTLYEGARPQGYDPMKKQGAIILGIGGDNSNSATGTFYEGVMTLGYSSDATDDAVQANIVSAGYGH